MEKTSLIFLTILIIENLLFLGLALIWVNRHCQKCEKVKCIERVFNKICANCIKDKTKRKKDPVEL